MRKTRYLIGMAGEELKGLLDRTGLSQKDFGKLFRYSDAQINRFLKGGRKIPDRAAIKIASVLNEKYYWGITPFDVKPTFMSEQLEPLLEADRQAQITQYKRSFLQPFWENQRTG